MTKERSRGYVSLGRSGIFRLPPEFQPRACSAWWARSSEAQVDKWSSSCKPSFSPVPCQTLLSKPKPENKSRGNGWNASAGCVADTACALVSVSFRWRLRGEGPGADLCGRNESPLVRTSHPGAEAVPTREGQQPVESETAAPGKPPHPLPAAAPALELPPRRCRSFLERRGEGLFIGIAPEMEA